MIEQFSFVFGALVAVLVVLIVGAIFVGTVALRAVGYFGRFRGFQAGRNAKGEMSFSGVVDETPPPATPPQLQPVEREPLPAPEVLN